MAFTKVTAAGISSATTLTIDSINSVGVVTASTVQVGSATTIHTTGIDLGGGNITSHNINSTGIITATGAVITGNLQVDGTTTTLDTIVTEVDKLEVSANNTNVAVAVTQSGTGDILRLYDGATQAVTVKDGGSVGIGSDSPQTKLDIVGDVRILDNSPRLFFIDANANGASKATGGFEVYDKDGNKNVFCLADAPNADNLLFGVTGQERLRITSGGLVGIGTDNPQSVLHLLASDAKLIIQDSDSSGNSGTPRIQFQDSTGAPAHGEIGYVGTGDSDLSIINKENANIQFHTNNTERLRITSGGDVGIGTNDPQSRFHVNATIDDNDAPQWAFHLTQDDPLNSFNQVGGSGIGILFKPATNSVPAIGAGIAAEKPGASDDDTTTDLVFYTSQNDETLDEAVRITSGGLVGIATDNPFATVTVAATVDTSVFAIAGNLGNNNGRAFQILTPTEDSTTSPFRIQTGNSMLFQTDANNCLYLGDLGHVGIHTLNPTFGQSTPISTYDPKFGVQGSIMIGNLSTTASDRHELQFYRRNGAAGQPIDTHDMGRIAWYGSNNDTDNAGLAWSIGVNPDGGSWFAGANRKGYMTFNNHDGEQIRIQSDGTLDLKYGVINLGTADSSSGHINAYELMSFNIDSDNDDSTRHFTWYKNGASANGTGMMRLNEDGRLGIGGDLATSANNLTLKHATTTEIDMHCTGGSGNNFRLKSDSAGVFTIRDHSSGNDRLTILDGGNIGLNQSNPDSRLHVVSSTNHTATFEYLSTSDMAIQLKNTQGSMYFGLGGGEGFAVATDSDLNGANNRFVIRQDGNTGINNVSPPVKLAVADSTDVKFLLSSSWSGTQQILFGGSNNSTGGANSTAAIIKCISSAPSGQAVGSLNFLVNSGDDFDNDRLVIYPQGLGDAKTNGGPALQIRSGNNGGTQIWSSPLRLQPQIYDADLGSGIFMFMMSPPCSDSTPTLVLRMRSGGIAHGEISMQMCRRTNSPSNAQFRRNLAKYVFAMYGEGDNDGSGIRLHNELYEYNNGITITHQGVIYVADNHPQYNTNTNGWLNGAHYLKYDFTGQQCMPVYIKIDMLYGAQYIWEAYWE